MIDINQLIDHVAAAKDNGNLPSEWEVYWAWTMQAIEDEELPQSVPLITFYQGEEYFTPRVGSPCFQSATSVIVAVMVCHKIQLKQRIAEIRKVIQAWKAPDKVHKPLYLSDSPSLSSKPIGIKGDYIWWQDHYMTGYDLLF